MTSTPYTARVEDGLSISRGPPLSEEEGLGTLTLAGYIREVTQKWGSREAAMITLDGETTRWTYDELWERALEVAKALVAAGVGKGTRVGILQTNRLEFLSCLFGTSLAGGIATTISTFFTSAELDEVLKAGCCSVLLIERNVLKKDFAEILGELETQIANGAAGDELESVRYPFLRHLAFVDSDESWGLIEGWSAFRARGKDVPDAIVDATSAAVMPSDPGLLFFSSGSTGKAKGVLSSHRGVTLQLWRWKKWYNIQEPPRTWSANGFFWSGNFGMAMGGTITAGGTLLLQRWFDPQEALELLEREKATMILAWPHQWAQMEAVPGWEDFDLSPMHYIDAKVSFARHPKINTEWREPRHAYGNTETFTLITVYASGTPEEISADTHGPPTHGSTIKIVDVFTGETMPIGERGEIAVKGPTLMMGYVGIPLDETLDEEGFLRCGDGGYIDAEGRLYWEGRLNDIIKTGGANVSPVEIDAVLSKCPGVKAVQTVGVPDELLGELVVSCVVPHDGVTLGDETIRAFAKEQLASYKVPRRVLFVEESDLKTTGSQKIKTADLRKLASERLAELEGTV